MLGRGGDRLRWRSQTSGWGPAGVGYTVRRPSRRRARLCRRCRAGYLSVRSALKSLPRRTVPTKTPPRGWTGRGPSPLREQRRVAAMGASARCEAAGQHQSRSRRHRPRPGGRRLPRAPPSATATPFDAGVTEGEGPDLDGAQATREGGGPRPGASSLPAGMFLGLACTAVSVRANGRSSLLHAAALPPRQGWPLECAPGEGGGFPIWRRAAPVARRTLG